MSFEMYNRGKILKVMIFKVSSYGPAMAAHKVVAVGAVADVVAVAVAVAS